MTHYLVYADQPTCLARTHTEALSRGCDPAGDTQYWWMQVAHPSNGQWALVVPDADVPGLTAPEQAAALDAAAMLAAGWIGVS